MWRELLWGPGGWGVGGLGGEVACHNRAHQPISRAQPGSAPARARLFQNFTFDLGAWPWRAGSGAGGARSRETSQRASHRASRTPGALTSQNAGGPRPADIAYPLIRLDLIWGPKPALPQACPPRRQAVCVT